MKLNIALCDDEAADLKYEEELISSVLPDNIDWVIDSFISPADMLKSDKIYNMVFLDVEMDDMNGIELARKLSEKKKDCMVFFITN